MRLSFINTKGGVGKTTSSRYVGEGLTRAGYNVCYTDLDPQKSLEQWLKQADIPLIPEGEPVFLVLDTPPADKNELDRAVKYSDRVFICTGASPTEIQRAAVTADYIQKKNALAKVSFILTRMDWRTRISTRSKIYLEKKYPTSPIYTISNKAAIAELSTGAIDKLYDYQKIVDDILKEHRRGKKK